MKKSWYKSVTIWSFVYVSLSLASRYLDVNLSEVALQGQGIVDAVVVLIGIWGRKRADQQLGA